MDAIIKPVRFLLALSALIPLLLAGCASAPPVQEMSDARQAIMAAREADAERYAPEALHGAEQLMDEATRKLESGAYEQARQAALTARVKAMKARDTAVIQAEAP